MGNLGSTVILRVSVVVVVMILIASNLRLSQQDTATVPLQSVAVRILDENGKPTPSRVRFTGVDSTYYAPEGHETDFPISQGGDVILDNDRRFAYIDGQFAINLPKTAVKVEVVKGYAYRLVADTVKISPETHTLEIQLERWFEFPDHPWYSGDVHVHHIDPATALLEMKAENLNVCNILTSDFTTDLENFRGAPDPVSEPDHIVYVNQEYREDRLGHINLLNLKKLIEPITTMRQYQFPLNIEACDHTHTQGGHVSWAHFAAWPGLEGPMGLVMKKIDAVELLCTIDPFHEPIFVTDVVPEVRMNSGLRLWYRLLNCGLQIPATAGTDKMDNQVTVGANRVYAAVEGLFTYQGWIDALNKGRTFISNSPFLFCKVDGKEPGETLTLSSGKSVEITAEVWSQLPVDRLEIIANGVLIAEKAVYPKENHAALRIIYTPRESVWIAARAYQFNLRDVREGVSFAQRRNEGGGPTLFNEYYGTLRPETVFAHTSPVYVIRNNRPIRSPKDAEYFVRYMDNSIAWLRTQGKFPSEEAKQSVLKSFEEGRQEFLKLAR